MAGHTRRGPRPPPLRADNSNSDDLVEGRQQRVTLESLGPFRHTVKQGDRKRGRNKNRLDDAESGSEVAPSYTDESGEETLTDEQSFITNHRQQHKYQNIKGDDWEGGDDLSDTVKQEKQAHSKERVLDPDPDQSPTPRPSGGFTSTPFTLIKRPHRIQPIQPVSYYLTQGQAFISQSNSQTPHQTPHQSIHHTPTSSGLHEEISELSEIVHGVNNYNLIRISPEKEAEKNAIMKNIGGVFEVEQWDPELPAVPDPDASPERLTIKPEPLTYTTVGSLVKSTDTRQFTAPNRIQREGRAGLEVPSRRPMPPTTNNSRGGQEFYSARNAPQYSNSQSYQNQVAQNFVPEHSPIGKYQSAQYDRRGSMRGQSSTPMYSSPGQAAADQSSGRDQSSAASHGVQQFGTRNPGREQIARQSFPQENPFSGQNATNSSANPYQPEHLQGTAQEQSTDTHGIAPLSHPITQLEAQVLLSLGAPLPMPSMASRQENGLPNAGKPFYEDMNPAHQALLTQLQENKPLVRSGNIQHQPIGNAASSVPTTVRPPLAMNNDAFMSGSSTNSAARLQDAKMSTVQRLAQFPNPDQERAKARLAELAASKMRGHDENKRFGQQLNSGGMSMPFDADHDGLDGDEFEADAYYQRASAENELNYGFRFPNSGANLPMQQYGSGGGSTSTVRPAGVPRKTPQGYPQPLTAGPPGQRQNTAPSTNKAHNSMQQMLANNNQRSIGPPNHQYALPQRSAHFSAVPNSSVSRPANPQPTTVEQPIIPDPNLYPWAQLDKQPRDFIDGAPRRIRETLTWQEANEYYPHGMDMDTIRSMITTLPINEAIKKYPQGMDEGTRKWYEEAHEWQKQPESDLGSLLNGSVPFNEWMRGSTFRENNNFNTVRHPQSKVQGHPSDAWFHSGNPNSAQEKGLGQNAESNGPGVIGQPRKTTKAGQSGNDKSLSVDEIKAMSLSDATGILLDNTISSLRKYQKTPENMAFLKARGFVDAPEHAIDPRPNGNESFFESGWRQPDKRNDRDEPHDHRASSRGRRGDHR